MRSKQPYRILALILLLWCPRMASPQPNQAKSSDETLVAKIKTAVAEKTLIEKVEAYVGQKALINTLRKKDQYSVLRAYFDDDPKEKTKIPDISQAANVVFWERPIKSRETRIVGILYAKDGKIEVFFGLLLDPG